MLLSMQVTLGAFVIWSGMDPVINTAHVVNGALVLGTSLRADAAQFPLGLRAPGAADSPDHPIAGSPDHRITKSPNLSRGPAMRGTFAKATVPKSDAVAIAGSTARARDFVALAKPRLNLLVVASTLVGYAMANGDPLGFWRVCGLLLGTGLVAGGASAFNQVIERDLDALMKRTRRRPMADQRLQPMEGLLFGSAITLAGLLLIVSASNLLAAAVALATLLSYVVVYTPLKRRRRSAR